MKNIKIRPANPSDAPLVGQLVGQLLYEIVPDHYGPEMVAKWKAMAANLLEQGTIWAYLAHDGDEAVGVITLHECHAIYAGGAFGEISELYVAPDYRSLKVGEQLIKAATSFARDRGWRFLAVGTGEQPKWHRSLAFYKRQGFVEIGPRLELKT